MEGEKIEGPITIRVPYEPTTAFHDLLKPFCDEIEASANSTDLVYQVWGLRLTDLVQALHYAAPAERSALFVTSTSQADS